MNDGLRTNIFVRYRVETIACACIFLAARLVKVTQPCIQDKPHPLNGFFTIYVLNEQLLYF